MIDCAWSTDGKWNTSDFKLLGFINSAKGDNMANISAVKKKSIGIIGTLLHKLEAWIYRNIILKVKCSGAFFCFSDTTSWLIAFEKGRIFQKNISLAALWALAHRLQNSKWRSYQLSLDKFFDQSTLSMRKVYFRDKK